MNVDKDIKEFAKELAKDRTLTYEEKKEAFRLYHDIMVF
jgi:hypothetical protein